MHACHAFAVVCMSCVCPVSHAINYWSFGVDPACVNTRYSCTGILEKRQERAERREAIHRRNVLGLLPEKKEKPPKRLGKKAKRTKRRKEREVRRYWVTSLRVRFPYKNELTKIVFEVSTHIWLLRR